MEEFNNKPGLALAGKTWDAQHLDKFLGSEWGGKLYKQYKPVPDASHSVYVSPFLKSSIRPSASFMSENRERKVVSNIDNKTQGNALVSWPAKSVSKSPVRKNLTEINQKMIEIEEAQKKSAGEYTKLMGPTKRKQLFEAEKQRMKVYSELKKEKLNEVKLDRIVKWGYPEGILGVDSPERPEKSPFYSNVQKTNDKFSKTQALNRINRAKYIMNHTNASPNIQFFNEKNSEIAEEKLGGIKRVDESCVHYHDTYASLFTPLPNDVSPERNERLKTIWRGGRGFDIISGTEYQN